MKALTIAALCGLLVGCGTGPPQPSMTSVPGQPSAAPITAPAPTVSASTLPVDLLAPSPPQAITDSLAATTRMRFTPLNAAQQGEVRIPLAVAEQTALSIGPQAYGTEGGQVVWKRVGCVYLGWYQAPMMPSYGYVPPTFPAYLVQIVGDPVPPEWRGINVEVVVVNATTGERDTIYGTGGSPIMGTTCGVPA